MPIKIVAMGLICAGWMLFPLAARGDEAPTGGVSRTSLRQLPIRFRQTDSQVGSSSAARATNLAASTPAASGSTFNSTASAVDDAASSAEANPARTRESAAPLPLAPRSRGADALSQDKNSSTGRALATIVSSLVVVVGILVGLAAAARRFRPAVRVLPDEVFMHLGTTTLAGRQTIHLVRFGDKLMLIAATAAGLQSLGELTDSEEVERLSALCRPRRSSPIASSLQRVLADWTTEASAISKASRGGASVVISPGRVGEVSHA